MGSSVGSGSVGEHGAAGEVWCCTGRKGSSGSSRVHKSIQIKDAYGLLCWCYLQPLLRKCYLSSPPCSCCLPCLLCKCYLPPLLCKCLLLPLLCRRYLWCVLCSCYLSFLASVGKMTKLQTLLPRRMHTMLTICLPQATAANEAHSSCSRLMVHAQRLHACQLITCLCSKAIPAHS